MGHYLSELTDGVSLDELQRSASAAEHDVRQEEKAIVQRITPLVAAYIALKRSPCTISEIEDALQPLGIDTFDVRDAISKVMHAGDAILTPDCLVTARNDLEISQKNRRALEAILLARVGSSLVAAGENLLLCHKYHPVAEIIDLLKEIGDAGAAQKLREAMVHTM